MKKIKRFLPTILIFMTACQGEEMIVPKPPTYLRLDLPNHTYTRYESNCGYAFQQSSLFKVKDVVDTTGKTTCHKDIDLGTLNGIIHFSYIEMKEPLATYVNFANDKVEDHKLKASAINDFRIIHPEKKVYGTFFELEGDVASPFQFYLTDSVAKFASGVVYFNCRPNYDSLKPSLDYLKIDLLKMIHSFEW
jgi:gliding motility-associated lipoprotein GldD